MAGPVFISYAREDSEFALRLATDLRAAGLDIWLDQLSLRPGEAWDEAIETALVSTSTLLLILSPDAIASKTVRDELAFALDKGKHVVPVLHRPSRIPLGIARQHYADFTNGYPVRELAALLDGGAVIAADPEPVAVTQKKPRRLRSTLAGAAIGAVCGLIAGLVAPNTYDDDRVVIVACTAFFWAIPGYFVSDRRSRQLWAATAAMAVIGLCALGGATGLAFALVLIGPMAATIGAWIAIYIELYNKYNK